MLVQYSQESSLAEAVAKTFDGQHPCGLCKKISGAQDSQKKGELLPLSLKPDLICAVQSLTLVPACYDISFDALTINLSTRFSSPSIPPPRSELA